MASTQEIRRRIHSVKNISQLTRALETVSASKAKKAVQAVTASQPYSLKAFSVLQHLANQPGQNSLHPLLAARDEVKKRLVISITSDRGLAGAFNVNMVKAVLLDARDSKVPVSYITVGRKGRDMLLRRRKDVIAEFSNIPTPPSYLDVAPIGKLAVEEFLNGNYDIVCLAYTHFNNMMSYTPIVKCLLPFSVQQDAESKPRESVNSTKSIFGYEPDQDELLNTIVPRFTAMQVYHAILASQASENAARMIAMRNATDNGNELISVLQLEYNKIRQQTITNDMLDIVGGAEAQQVTRANAG